MLLKVGPFVYRVVLVAGYIEHDGEDCLGLCDNETHELFISDRCSTAQQVQVIAHEYMEAWIYHFGRDGMDKEAWCDLFGLAMTQFVLDLMQTLRLDPAAWAAGMQDATGNLRVDPGQPNADRTDPKSPRTRRSAAVRVFRRQDSDAEALTTAAGAGPPETTPAPSNPDIQRWRNDVVELLKRGLQDAEDA